MLARSVALAALALASAALETGCRGAAPEPSKKATEGAVAASSAPAAAPPRAVRFSPQRYLVGEKSRSTRAASLKMSVEFWQENEKLGTNDSSRAEEYVRIVEVLGLVGASPAKVRVHYDHYHLTEIQPDKPAREVGVIEGKTYVLDATEGKLRATTAEGKKLPSDEAAVLTSLHGELGEDDPIAAALGSAPMPVGERRPMRDKLFRAFLGTTAGEYKSGSYSLAGTRLLGGRDVADLEWTAELQTQEDNGLETTWHLDGKATLAIAPASTLKTSMSAVLDLSGHTTQNGAKVQMMGAGSMKEERTTQAL